MDEQQDTSSADKASANADSPTHKKNGQFAKGNRLGKGNPWNKEVGALRKFLFEEISKKDWEGIKEALINKSLSGDVKALTLLLGYSIGKPVEKVDVNMTQTFITPEQARQRIAEFFGTNKEQNERDTTDVLDVGNSDPNDQGPKITT